MTKKLKVLFVLHVKGMTKGVCMPRVAAVDLVISREYNFKSSRENLCVYLIVHFVHSSQTE